MELLYCPKRYLHGCKSNFCDLETYSKVIGCFRRDARLLRSEFLFS